MLGGVEAGGAGSAQVLVGEEAKLRRHGVRVRVLGERARLPEVVIY